MLRERSKEKAIKYLVTSDIFTEEECNETEAGKFYVKNYMKGWDVCDIDRYAWLNTLFQYDIGIDNAMEIDSWLWDKPFEEEVETLELTYKDKEIVEKAVKAKGLDLDFSKWITYDPVAYMYF